MKITAINGSPKGEGSNSREIISIMQTFLPAETEWHIENQIAQKYKDKRTVLTTLFESDVLVIVFPLYVDGLPASLMQLLERYSAEYQVWKKTLGQKRDAQRVFGISNCGFHEGLQNDTALAMIENFCETTGLGWCGGAGLGTGEMILGLKNMSPKAGIRKPVIQAIRAIAQAIQNPPGRLEENIYTQHKFPWLLYKIAGEFGWRQMTKKNGLKRGALSSRPLCD